MVDETTGNELVLTAPTSEALVKQRSKPSLIRIGNRDICTDGRFHPDLAADYVRANARDGWLKIGDLARVFTGANTIDGKKRVRRRLFSVFTRLLAYDEFLVYETDASTGRIHAVKLLDMTSEQERQAARPQLERMRQRQQVSSDKYEKAIQVIERKETMADEMLRAAL